MRLPISQLEEWTIEGAGCEFDARDFEQWHAPGVYVLLDCDGKALYVGMGKDGLERLAQRGMNHPHRHWAFQELFSISLSSTNDAHAKIKLFPCKSVEAAEHLEEYLIHVLKPHYNQRRRESYLKRLLGRATLATRFSRCPEILANSPMKAEF